MKDLRKRAKKAAKKVFRTDDPFADEIDRLVEFAREIRNEALEEVCVVVTSAPYFEDGEMQANIRALAEAGKDDK